MHVSYGRRCFNLAWLPLLPLVHAVSSYVPWWGWARHAQLQHRNTAIPQLCQFAQAMSALHLTTWIAITWWPKWLVSLNWWRRYDWQLATENLQLTTSNWRFAAHNGQISLDLRSALGLGHGLLPFSLGKSQAWARLKCSMCQSTQWMQWSELMSACGQLAIACGV